MTNSILYIHGLNSSPASTKASQLTAAMTARGLQAQLRVPALHHHPRQAVAQLGVDHLRHAAGGLEVRGVQAQVDGVAFVERGRHGPFHLRTERNAACAQVVDLHLAATG